MVPSHRHWGTCSPLGSWWAICHSGKHWNWRGLECKARRARRGQVFWGRRPRNPKWDWWSRSANQLYHPFCQCSQAVPEEKLELFQVWESWPSCEGLSKGSQQGHQKSEFKCKRGDNKEGMLDPSETSSCSTGIPRWGSQHLKTSKKVPFLNPNPLNQWSGPECIAWV